MILDKNQKMNNNQDVKKLVSLINDDEISYLIDKELIISIERNNSITYIPTNKLLEFLKPDKNYFDLFYNMYPIYVTRPTGIKSFLRSNINKCRKLYNLATNGNEYVAKHINNCLSYEIDKKMKYGQISYMKTMYRWLQDHQWEETEEELLNNSDINNKEESYGNELF